MFRSAFRKLQYKRISIPFDFGDISILALISSPIIGGVYGYRNTLEKTPSTKFNGTINGMITGPCLVMLTPLFIFLSPIYGICWILNKSDN